MSEFISGVEKPTSVCLKLRGAHNIFLKQKKTKRSAREMKEWRERVLLIVCKMVWIKAYSHTVV